MDDFLSEFGPFNGTADWNETEAEMWTPGPEHYIVPPLLVLTGIVGLLGNGALVFVLRRASARSAPDTFILNLALADLLVLLFFLPFSGQQDSYPFGEIICAVSETCYEIAVGVSAFTLTAMSAQCFLGGGQETPRTLQSALTKRNAVIAVAVIWALAVVFAVPTMLLTHVLESPRGYAVNDKICLSTKPDAEISMIPFRLTVFYAIPLMAGAFFLLIARLNRTDHAQGRTQNEFARLVFALLAVYAVCFFAHYMVTVQYLLHDGDYPPYWKVLYLVAYYLTIVYPCLNPVALYFVSGSFRQLFNRHLLCWCTSRNMEPVADLERPLQDTALGALRQEPGTGA